MSNPADRADRSERHAVIRSVVIAPGHGQPGQPEEILRYFDTTDGQQLGLNLLRDALRCRDEEDAEMALVVCSTFGITPDHLQPLLELFSADWHKKHEDVVTALLVLHAPAAVPAFVHATRWIPDYLDYDESRALARKAIHALGETQARRPNKP